MKSIKSQIKIPTLAGKRSDEAPVLLVDQKKQKKLPKKYYSEMKNGKNLDLMV